jgi:hypothetical protein
LCPLECGFLFYQSPHRQASFKLTISIADNTHFFPFLPLPPPAHTCSTTRVPMQHTIKFRSLTLLAPTVTAHPLTHQYRILLPPTLGQRSHSHLWSTRASGPSTPHAILRDTLLASPRMGFKNLRWIVASRARG